jgi:hypothetical protein
MSIIDDFIAWITNFLHELFGGQPEPDDDDDDPTPNPETIPEFVYLKGQLAKNGFGTDTLKLKFLQMTIVIGSSLVDVALKTTFTDVNGTHQLNVAITAHEQADGTEIYTITQAALDGRAALGTILPPTTNSDDSVVDGGKN